MKKISFFIVFLAFLMIVVIPATLFAQAPGGVSFSSGTPEFNFQIPISGLKSLTLCEPGSGGTLSCPGIAKYVQVAYTFLVGFAAVLAVLAITWGGVQWLISRGESGKIQEARKIIGNAVVGLVIALGSYAILSVINPNLTQFNPLTIKPIKLIELDILGELAAIGGSKDEAAYRVPVTGCPDNPTVSYLGKTYTKKIYGEVWADVLCRHGSSFFLVNRKTGKPVYNPLADVHETTHMINAGGKLYLGNGEFLPYSESEKITLDDVAERLSPKLQQGDKTRFDTYINTKYKGTDKWDAGVAKQNNGFPVMGVLDDFSAYTVDAKAFVEMYGKNLPGKTLETGSSYINTNSGTASFVAYGLALAQTLEDKDPNYLKDGVFKKTLERLIEEAMKTYRQSEAFGADGIGDETKAMYNGLRTDSHPNAQKLRDLAKRWYNVGADPTWTQRVLGF